MKTLQPLLFSLVLSFSMSHAADAPQGPGTVQGREKIKEMVIQKFDANKNGTLDPDEKAAAMKAMQERKAASPKGGSTDAKGPMQAMILQKFDANKNGTLDPDEKATAMKAMQERRSKSGGSPGAGAGTNAEGGSKFRRPPEPAK